MARRGRQGDWRNPLGSLFRTTVQQLDAVREVVDQKVREGKMQLDLTLLKRKRRDALARLGEAVADLAARGHISEEDFPELSSPLSEIEALDERIALEERRARGAAAPDEEPGWERAAHYDEAEDLDDLEDEDWEDDGEDEGASAAPSDLGEMDEEEDIPSEAAEDETEDEPPSPRPRPKGRSGS